jgi:serine/threonine-protein kinase RsbW
VSESLSDHASGAERSEVGTVELTVPADPAYVAVLRTVTASLAARRDFTLDEIDDLRIAVDEACALLLPHARPASALSAGFGEADSSLQITVSVELADGASDTGPVLDETSFAWMVLTALADSVTSQHTDGRLRLTLTKARSTRN